MQSNVPSRLRKTAFDRFAPYLGQAIKQFPRALVIDPSPLTPDSFVSALRAAIKGKREYNHCSSYIDEMLWLKHIDSLVCSMRVDGKIIIGNATTVKEPSGWKYGKETSQLFEFNATYPELWDCLCKILSARAISPAITFRAKIPDQATRDRLEQQYDIAFIEDSQPDTFIIL